MKEKQFNVLTNALDFRKGVRFDAFTIGLARSILIDGKDLSPDRAVRRRVKSCASVFNEIASKLDEVAPGMDGVVELYHYFTKTANQVAIDTARYAMDNNAPIKSLCEAVELNTQSVYNAIENLERLAALRADWGVACQQ